MKIIELQYTECFKDIQYCSGTFSMTEGNTVNAKEFDVLSLLRMHQVTPRLAQGPSTDLAGTRSQFSPQNCINSPDWGDPSSATEKWLKSGPLQPRVWTLKECSPIKHHTLNVQTPVRSKKQKAGERGKAILGHSPQAKKPEESYKFIHPSTLPFIHPFFYSFVHSSIHSFMNTVSPTEMKGSIWGWRNSTGLRHLLVCNWPLSDPSSTYYSARVPPGVIPRVQHAGCGLNPPKDSFWLEIAERAECLVPDTAWFPKHCQEW